MGKVREAVQELEKESGLVPENFVIHLELARIYSRLDERELARRHATLARQLKSEADEEELGTTFAHPPLTDHEEEE
jgi:Flp pilus assembly protein TadD